MPETTPLIKAALNLRGGAGFDVYSNTMFFVSTDTNSFVVSIKFFPPISNFLSLLFATIHDSM